MLKRFLAPVAMMLLLDACDRLSPNDRRVVGTWVAHTIDSDDYTIVRRNHIFEEVSNLGGEELTLLCLGNWRTEGNDIVTELQPPRRSWPRKGDSQSNIFESTFHRRFPEWASPSCTYFVQVVV